jgi:hypothetical protein
MRQEARIASPIENAETSDAAMPAKPNWSLNKNPRR